MNLFDVIKTKYLHELGPEKAEHLEKCITTNLWPHDYIEVNGETKHVYDPTVKLEDILVFFKSKMPWMKYTLLEPPPDQSPDEKLVVKYVCFTQLAGMLEASSLSFSASMSSETKVLLEKYKDEKVLH